MKPDKKLILQKPFHSKKFFKIWLVISIIFSCVITNIAQNYPVFHFKQFSLKDGLTQTTVRDILRDSQGYLWIGTASGLNRYDGYTLETYFSFQDEANGLPGNLIFFIAEDTQKNIWVSTNRGLARFNKENHSFELQHINNVPFESSSYCLLPDGIVCGLFGKLIKYVYDKRTWEFMPIKSKNKLAFQFNDIIPWDKNHLLLSSRYNGLFIYNVATGEIKEASFYKSNKNIVTIFLDSQKKLWIAPYGKGLECYSKNGELIAKYNTTNSQISYDVILDIIEKDGNLWIATDGGGINIFNAQTNTFSHIRHTPENPTSFPANSILKLYEDKWGCLWVGSVRNGLIELKTVSMKTYGNASWDNPFGLTNKAVISLLQDDDGNIWIGTDGGGINKLNSKTEQFKHFSSSMDDKVTSIANFSSTELLIAVFNQGIFFFDKKTGRKKKLIIIDEETDKRISQSGFAATIYSQDGINFQIFSDNIYIYNKETKLFSTLPLKKEDIDFKGVLKQVTSDSTYRYLFDTNKIYRLTSEKTYTTLLKLKREERINAVAMDHDTTFWIATNKGLCTFNLHSENKIEPIALPFKQTITSLVCDHKNRLWIGTHNTLWRYTIDSKKFEMFNESNGVIPNEYIQRSTLITKDGNIYMGGVNGLLFIRDNLKNKKYILPKIRLTEVVANDKNRTPLYIADEESKIPKIRLPWNKSSITLRVIVQEKDIFRKRLLRYHIKGLSKEPIETYEQALLLQPLPDGTYNVAISCNLPDGTWTEPKNVLELSISPPWWKSSWFTLLLILLGLFISILIVYILVKRKEDALKWELKEREQEMYAQKVKFLINISHELRTPLTLIYAPLKRILQNIPENDTLRNSLENIYKQAAHMKQIINMVLDMRKIETGNEKLHIKSYPLHEWIRETADYFSEETSYRKMVINFAFDNRIKNVPFDKDKCKIVLSNLLSNALKFGATESVITISTELQEDENRVRISVSDQGVGLKDVDTSLLFSRFYQGNHEFGGSGIGLAFSKTLVDLHGGTMGARNNTDSSGATFFFELPLSHNTQKITSKTNSHINNLISPEDTLLYNNYNQTINIDTSSYTLLVVEDNSELLDFLYQIFKDNFKTVYTATNGVEALKLIHEKHPDIIVSDVVMPKMDGFELCRRIKSDIAISHIPIILLTARNDSENVQLGYKLGADAYVSKPFDSDFLQIIIKNQLNIREQIKARYQSENNILPPEEITFSNADEIFISKLNTLINKHLGNPQLNVAFICSEIGMSRASLYNKMKDLLDIGVNDYINRLRLEKAAEMLIAYPDVSIADIATKVGFSTQRYFSSSFKKFKGVSPSVYRTNNRKFKD